MAGHLMLLCQLHAFIFYGSGDAANQCVIVAVWQAELNFLGCFGDAML